MGTVHMVERVTNRTECEFVGGAEAGRGRQEGAGEGKREGGRRVWVHGRIVMVRESSSATDDCRMQCSRQGHHEGGGRGGSRGEEVGGN